MTQKLNVAGIQREYPNFFGMSIEESKALDEKLDREIKEGRYFWNSFYLHGELENIIGYDLCVVVNEPELDLEEYPVYHSPTRLVKHCLLKDEGKFEVEVKGINEKCIGYFWKCFSENENKPGIYYHASQRGYICLERDREAVEQAAINYIEQPLRI